MKFCKHLFLSVIFFFAFIKTNAQDLRPKSWKANYKKGVNYLEQDSIKQAWPYLRDAYLIAKENYKPKSKFTQSLHAFYKISILYKQNDIIDSLNLTDEVMEISKSLKGKKRLKFSKDLEVFADSLLNDGQFNNAIKLYEERKINLEVSNTNNETYAKVLYGLGRSYKNTRKNNIKAKEHLERALEIVESSGPFEVVKSESVLADLLPIYINLRNKEKANEAAIKSLDIIEQKEGDTSKAYTDLLIKNFGVVFWQAGFLDKATEYENRAIQILESKGDFDSGDYQYAYFVLALVEKKANLYLESLEAFKKVQAIMVKKNDIFSNGYAQVLGNIGLNYDRIGDYERALKYCNESLSIPKISAETKSIRLMDKAYFYQNMGQYKISHQMYDQAMKYMTTAIGTNKPEYGKLLNNIGKLYFVENKLEEALKYFKDGLEIVEVPEGEKWHPFYSYMLNDYAKTLFELGETAEAIKLMEKNITYFEVNDLNKDEAYYNRKSSLARAYNLTGDYQSALPLIEEAAENLNDILGENHVDYGQFLDILSDTYFGVGYLDKAVTALEVSNNVFVNQIDKIFRFSSEKEKKEFLQMITLNFNQMQSMAITKNIDNANLNSINLNNQLMLKGLLLNNSKDILIKLKGLQNDTIDNLIRDYKNLKSKRTRALTEYSEESKIFSDSLGLIINEKEAELVKLYTSNFENSVSLVRNWKSIQSHLKGNDVAIEFSHFDVLKDKKPTGKVEYVAYVVNATNDYPMMIRLFEESELKKTINRKSPDQLYTGDALYNLIWKPLEAHISKGANVYYAPSGLLNQISFAAISNKNQPLILKNELIQLSSTFKLTENDLPIDTYSALLIGGITYDYDLEGKDESMVVNKNAVSFLNNSAITKRRGTKSRGESWTYLEGTLDEIESLNEVFKKQRTNVSILSRNKATETEFKNYNGNSPNLIHIATHGFFYEKLNIDAYSETNLSKEDQYRLAEDPLLRSGLILAGANYAWKNDTNPYENEDGILTAMEISNLDLSNTNLVVLSACKTGLGDIDGSEGVYGLQRAFKMAGVDRLIMSLWEVPDEATASFMSTFYNNWLNGISIREAFIKTQRQIYKIYPNNPGAWAAFVLFQ